MNFEEAFGIRLSAFVAGLIGGLISLTYEHQLSPIRALALILAGGVTAGYSFTALEYYWNLHPTTTGIASFGLGLVSMRLIDALIGAADVAKDLVLRFARLVWEKPALLLSISDLVKTIKNGSSTSSNSGVSSELTGLDSPRASDKETSE